MFQYNEVKNPVFKYAILGVSIAVVIGIVWFFNKLGEAFNIGGGGSKYNVISSISSPLEKYIANSYVMMGGGAAGWCYKLVTVRKHNEGFDTDKEIFKVRCSSELEVNWINDNSLNIASSEESTFESKTEWNGVKISHSLIKIDEK